MKYKLINTDEIFVDATHVKACANSKKMRKRVAHEQAPGMKMNYKRDQ